jgi:hypothetical protein
MFGRMVFVILWDGQLADLAHVVQVDAQDRKLIFRLRVIDRNVMSRDPELLSVLAAGARQANDLPPPSCGCSRA